MTREAAAAALARWIWTQAEHPPKYSGIGNNCMDWSIEAYNVVGEAHHLPLGTGRGIGTGEVVSNSWVMMSDLRLASEKYEAGGCDDSGGYAADAQWFTDKSGNPMFKKTDDE